MANIKVVILDEPCTGCQVCKRECPVEAISGEKKQVHVLDQDKCVQCLLCFEACRFSAIAAEVDGKQLDVIGSKKKQDDLVACTRCGEPVGSKQRVAVMRTVNPQIEAKVFDLCPGCRRADYAEQVAVEGYL